MTEEGEERGRVRGELGGLVVGLFGGLFPNHPTIEPPNHLMSPHPGPLEAGRPLGTAGEGV